MPSSVSDAEDSFPFMRLPLELRDQIYRELLTPKEKVNSEENELCYTLEPAILCCSKQIHGETCRVLYEENAWIRFTSDETLLQQLDLPRQCRIFATNLESFPSPVAVNVTIQPTNNAPQQARLAENILHLSDLTIFVCTMYMEFPDNLAIYHLHLDIDDTFHKYNNDEENLLDAFQDIRGFGKASITGTASLSTGQELATLLTKPHQKMDELLNRLRHIQTRADDKAASMQIKDARLIYWRGIMSVSVFEMREEELNWTKSLRLNYKRLSFCFDMVGCNIKLGHASSYPFRLDDYLGMASVEAARKISSVRKLLNAGKGREALRTLVPALRMIRKEYRIDEEIDAIEARLVATGLLDLSGIREKVQESTNSLDHTE